MLRTFFCYASGLRDADDDDIVTMRSRSDKRDYHLRRQLLLFFARRRSERVPCLLTRSTSARRCARWLRASQGSPSSSRIRLLRFRPATWRLVPSQPDARATPSTVLVCKILQPLSCGHSNAGPVFRPSLRKMMAAGQKPVNADWNRFAPTKTARSKQ